MTPKNSTVAASPLHVLPRARSALLEAVLSELHSAPEEQRRELADVLRPHIAPAGPEPWLYGIEAIAAHVGCPASRLHPDYRRDSRMPVYRDGKILTAKPSELDAWRKAQG